jgi:hypothetical protein
MLEVWLGFIDQSKLDLQDSDGWKMSNETNCNINEICIYLNPTELTWPKEGKGM